MQTNLDKMLTALPVYNEADSVDSVLQQVTRYSDNVLVVDDGSTDGTSQLLAGRNDISVVTHPGNMGYGAALLSAFRFAIDNEYQELVTIDCDGQHEPQRIQELVHKLKASGADIVSGSRYLKSFDANSQPPAQRRWINRQITREINDQLGLNITDAFCGFKAYRVESLQKLHLTETGYAMPLELWVQAACAKLTIVELAVPLIYLDEHRSFGGELDDGATRINYYHQVLQRSLRELPNDCPELRAQELAG